MTMEELSPEMIADRIASATRSLLHGNPSASALVIVQLSSELDAAIAQRDRALALLCDPRVGTSCGYPDEPMAKCSGDWGEGADVKISDTCWWHSCRALQDDVDRAP